MSWYYDKPYVPVAERRRQGAAATKKLAKKAGRALAPVQLATSKIATTFWGKAWCDNLEAYSDFENRLPRGRSYVRNGSVLDLQISKGIVNALVQGSDLYEVSIKFKVLAPARWKKLIASSAGKVTNLLDLLQGRLSQGILADITAPDIGLFPTPAEIDLNCSCPDWAEMCKHVAAVLYGVGARLDSAPELFFTLRGVEVSELVDAASASATTVTGSAQSAMGLEESALSEIFGVEIEIGTRPSADPPKVKRKKTATKPARTVSKAKPAAKASVKAKSTKRRPSVASPRD